MSNQRYYDLNKCNGTCAKLNETHRMKWSNNLESSEVLVKICIEESSYNNVYF